MSTWKLWALLALAIAGCASNVASKGAEAEEPTFADSDEPADSFTRRLAIQGTIGFGETKSGAYARDGYAGYLFTAGRGASLQITLRGAGNDPVLFLYGPQSSRRWSGRNPIARNDDFGDSFDSRIDFRVREAGTYLLLVREYWGTAGNFELTLGCTGASCQVECGADNSCPTGAECERRFCIRAPCPSFCEPVDPTIACEADADCVAIPSSCCGCNMGGSSRAVNASYAESLTPECAESTICPAVYLCDGAVPTCMHNRCEMIVPQPEEPPPGIACGTRGATFDCGEGNFCNRPIGANCGRADAPGYCTPIPEFCTKELFPVCGCDGVTYQNRCMANAEGVSVDYEGECRAPISE